jgi:hypothetical protein
MKALLSMLLAVSFMPVPQQQPRAASAPRGWSIEFYDASKYKGNIKVYKSATRDTGAWSRRAKSAIIVGVWEICDQADFKGNCRMLRSSIADLKAWGFTGPVKSVRPFVSRRVNH